MRPQRGRIGSAHSRRKAASMRPQELLCRRGIRYAAMKAMSRGEAAECLAGSRAKRASLNTSAALLLLTLLVAGAQPVANTPVRPSPTTNPTKADTESAFDNI